MNAIIGFHTFQTGCCREIHLTVSPLMPALLQNQFMRCAMPRSRFSSQSDSTVQCLLLFTRRRSSISSFDELSTPTFTRCTRKMELLCNEFIVNPGRGDRSCPIEDVCHQLCENFSKQLEIDNKFKQQKFLTAFCTVLRRAYYKL